MFELLVLIGIMPSIFFTIMLVFALDKYSTELYSVSSEKEIINSYKNIKILKRNSLRNPLVEQMINETLMIVKDIWKQYGKPDEIKVELARELKNSVKEREKIHDANEKGRKVNDRDMDSN